MFVLRIPCQFFSEAPFPHFYRRWPTIYPPLNDGKAVGEWTDVIGINAIIPIAPQRIRLLSAKILPKPLERLCLVRPYVLAETATIFINGDDLRNRLMELSKKRTKLS